MNIPSNQQTPGDTAMSHMSQPTNSQMTQGQQRATQQSQQQAQQQKPEQSQQQLQKTLQQPLQRQLETDENLHTVIPKLYAKVQSLVGPLRETLTSLVNTAALTLQQNNLRDAGSSRNTDSLDKRFNKIMEKFYSICDQIEYYLKTMIEIQNQSSSSERYMPLPVITPRTEKAIGQKPALSYAQYLMTIKNQVSYANEVHDALMSAANSLAVENW